MKVVVFGGTGSIGRLVVDQALEQGPEVTVFTRDRAQQDSPRLQAEQGNVFDARHRARKDQDLRWGGRGVRDIVQASGPRETTTSPGPSSAAGPPSDAIQATPRRTAINPSGASTAFPVYQFGVASRL